MLAGWQVGQEENETYSAPDAQEDENDRDEGQLAVRHGCQRVWHRAAGQNGTIFWESSMLEGENKTEHMPRVWDAI